MIISNRAEIDGLMDEYGSNKMVKINNEAQEELCLCDLAYFYDGQELELDIIDEFDEADAIAANNAICEETGPCDGCEEWN